MKTESGTNSQKTKQSAVKTASGVTRTIPKNHGDSELEAALQRRKGGVASIGQIMPSVFRTTLAQARRHHREAA